MECDEVRDALVDGLSVAEGDRWAEPVARHLAGCQGCRAELEDLRRTWAALGQLPDAIPSDEIRVRLYRRVRRELLRESVLTVGGWAPAVLAAVVGVGLSLGLSLLVPYASLVALCQRLLQAAEPHWAPYLLAGAAYGMPLVVGAWVLRRRPLGGALVGGLEASVLFVIILAPYAIAQCREFAPPLQVTFVSGLAAGAVLASLAGIWLLRLAQAATVRA